MTFDFTVKEFILGNGTGTPTLQFYKRGFELNGGGSSPSWQDIVLSGNGSLTLTNAKENGLNYLKLFGGTEQRNLPSGYTEYDGLIGDGLAYVNLDCPMTQDDEIVIEFTKTEDITSRDLGGFRQNASSNNISALISSTGNIVADFNNSDYTSYRLNQAINLNTRYRIVINKTGRYLYQGSTLVGSNTTACNDAIACSTCYLFYMGSTVGGKFIGTIHRASIKGKRDVVPCGNGTAYGMYDKLNGVFYPNANTEGSFTVGNVTVPTPTAPMDIVCNNGVIKYSANMCNVNAQTALVGYYINNSGVVIADANNWIYQNYIAVKPNTTYTLSFDTNAYFVTISEYSIANDSGFIVRKAGNSGENTSLTITTESTTNYIRFGTNLDRSTVTLDRVLAIDWMLNMGDTMAYQPYVEGGIYTDGTTETVSVHGKNLIQDVANSSSAIAFADCIPIKAGTYKLSAENNGADIYRIYITTRDANGNAFQSTVSPVAGTYYSSGRWQSAANLSVSSITRPNGITVTINEDCYLGIGYSNNTTGSLINWQLELGSTATTYEPYYNGGSATAEMLLAIGSYQDVQSVLDGSVTRNVGIKVLDGTESWTASGNLFYAGIATDALEDTHSCYCTHFKGVATNASANYDNEIKVGTNVTQTVNWTRVQIYPVVGTYSNVTAFKQFLATQYANGTPVIVVYPLATATTESVTGQPLSIQAGSNIVEITQASIDNLGLEVSYKGTI